MVSSDTTVSSPFSTGEQVGSHLGERGQLPKSKFSREQWLRSASDLLFSLSNSTTHERCSLAHSRKALMESCHLLDLGHRSCSEKTLSGLLRWAAHLNTPATFCKWMNNSFCWNFPDLHSLKQTPGLPNFGQVLKNWQSQMKQKLSCCNGKGLVASILHSRARNAALRFRM